LLFWLCFGFCLACDRMLDGTLVLILLYLRFYIPTMRTFLLDVNLSCLQTK
jgi:hypothetical protein